MDMKIDNDMDEQDVESLVQRVKGVVTISKASGTEFLIEAFTKLIPKTSESVAVSDSACVVTIQYTNTEGLVRGLITVGALWKVGTPGLVVGINDAIKEQAAVTVLNSADEPIYSIYLGG